MSSVDEAPFLNFADILNSDEVKKFDATGHDWFDVNGSFKTLHRINPIRIQYIERMIATYCLRVQVEELSSAENRSRKRSIKILDLGCGGGLASEALSNLGYDVVGADASEGHVKIVQKQYPNSKVNYITFSRLAELKMCFDVVLCLEMIEHVQSAQNLVGLISQLVDSAGIVVLSTINRTPKSYFTAVLMAEYILRIIPKNTHSYAKLLRPSEIVEMFTKYNMRLLDLTGLSYSFLQQEWRLINDLGVNYFLTAAIMRGGL
ncbi:Ubiquinone biosynthesis O-methyltransferase [Rickettsiales endosymbiont of Paramecium tredecaurelia]|uniref:bifunctional 2-polyprenyl-6-hydroxyphenol methylase/3-demethylubiquinol 3-O-methyltransferase UbiG n=1 Tax=Candidatus Sarmatiella mevalonica TaxID=2770581 RepID=UPI001920A1F9|nr:bifunctional 2-polyprenyl-6-hydroxyphenol methylase/3-demethylubiquinol 3-O-methyltransferase UbiG [Candidatus Sarmatiella mevalonica]MBL3284169.1 Ubiquinone biosynthesis O-methyltransferase [Candidatus Sarmatiella mevalonica]